MQTSRVTVPRVGAPESLCAQVLTRGLDQLPSVEFAAEQAPALRDGYLRGRLHCALVPVLDGLQPERARMLPGLGLCFEGASGSEWLGAKKELSELARVAVDRRAPDAGTLARVLLAEEHGVHPEIETIDLTAQPSESYDAVVVGGDAGLAWVAAYPYRVDLTAWWCDATGLPFVAAAWFSPGNASHAGLRSVTSQAMQNGMRSLDAIADAGALQSGLGRDVVYAYLAERVHYRVGSAEMDAIREFVSVAGRHGLCSTDLEVALC